jgi:hypothetical protein
MQLYTCALQTETAYCSIRHCAVLWLTCVCSDLQGVYVFYLQLLTDMLHLCVYLVFFVIVFTNYGLPLHLVRVLTDTNSLVYLIAGECGLDVRGVSTKAVQWCRCGICTGPSATLETELLIS